MCGLLLGACTRSSPRWRYGPQEDAPNAANAASAAAFDPSQMERAMVEHGCTGCHTFHGDTLIGPPLGGGLGAVRHLQGGGTVVVDERYLVESILEPSAKVLEGYPNVMPSYAETLDEATCAAMAAYLVSLR